MNTQCFGEGLRHEVCNHVEHPILISNVWSEAVYLFRWEILEKGELGDIGDLAFQSPVVAYLTRLVEVYVWMATQLAKRQRVDVQLLSMRRG